MMAMDTTAQPAQMTNSASKRSFFSRLKFSWGNIWSWLGIILLLLVSYSLVNLLILNPYQTPKDIRVTNVTSRSATVSWVTEKASRGVVIWGEESGFKPSVLASLGKEIAYDDRDVAKAVLEGAEKLEQDLEERDAAISSGELETDIKVSELGSYHVHHVTIKDLDPEKEYFFMVGDGVRFSKGEGSFADDVFTLSKSNSLKTFTEPEELEQPNPTYGKIVLEGDVNSLVDDAIVFLRPGVESNSAPLSASVNEEGNWYIDFSNARSSDGLEILSFNEDFDDHEVFVEGGKFGVSGVRQEPMDMDAPMFDIELSSHNLRESSLLQNLLSKFVAEVDANWCSCPNGNCGATIGTANECYRILCPDGRSIMWDSKDNAVCTGTAIVTPKKEVVVTQETATDGGSTTQSYMCYHSVNGTVIPSAKDPNACRNASGVWDTKAPSTGGSSVSTYRCYRSNGTVISSAKDPNACRNASGTWATSAPKTPTVPEKEEPQAPSREVGVCVIEGVVRNGLTEQECRSRSNGKRFEWNKGAVISPAPVVEQSIPQANPSGEFCNPIGKVVVFNGITFICTRQQRGATYVRVMDEKDPVVTRTYCKHNASLQVVTTTTGKCDPGWTVTGNQNIQICNADGGCVCAYGRRVLKGEYCDNSSAKAVLDIAVDSVCPAGRSCFCSKGSPKELSGGEKCEAPIPQVARNRICEHAECRCSIPVMSGVVVSEYQVFVIKEGRKCTSDLLESRGNPVRSAVHAQTSITISAVNGIFAVEDSGIYCGTYNSERYCFDLTDEGSKTLYIDANNNGVFDEGDINMGEDSVKIALSLEEKTSKYNIKTGFNLVSFDFVSTAMGTTAKEVLEYLNINYDDAFYSIAKFDSGKWVVIGNRDGETYGSDNFQILPGQGYLLKSKYDLMITLGGKAVVDPVPVSLRPGWNLIGLAGTKKAYTAETLISNVNQTAGVISDNVTKYETALGRYVGLQKEVNAVYGIDYPLTKTVGYFLRVKEGTGVWTP